MAVIDISESTDEEHQYEAPTTRGFKGKERGSAPHSATTNGTRTTRSLSSTASPAPKASASHRKQPISLRRTSSHLYEDGDDDEAFEALSITAYRSTATKEVPTSASKPKSKAKGTSKPASVKEANTTKPSVRAVPENKPKPPLSVEELQRIRRQQEREAEQDDFFMSKKQFVFRTKSGSLAPVIRQSKTPDLVAKGAGRDNSPQSMQQFKPVVINLDSDEESSGSDSKSSKSSNSDDSDTNKKKRKKRSSAKKASKVKSASPIKLIVDESLSSTTSESGSDTSSIDSDSTREARKIRKRSGKQKQDKLGGGKGKERALNPDSEEERDRKRSRSLTPITQVDSFAVAHALQDIRRNMSSKRVRTLDDNDDEELLRFIDANIGPKSATSEQHSPGTRSRSISSQPPLRDILSPDRDIRQTSTASADRPLTEMEQEARYGVKTLITVTMVLDPRIETSHNEASAQAFTAPIEVTVRARENFGKLLDSIATLKNIPIQSLVLTYNDKQIYRYGTPSALNIISKADFLGYHHSTHLYLKTKKAEDRRAQIEMERQAQRDALAAGEVAAEDILNGGDIHDKEATPPPPGPTIALPPSEPMVRLSIQGGKAQKLLIAVPTKRTILSLIKHYLKQSNLPKDRAGRCKIMLDGEELGHKSTIEEAGIEDEDSLDIRVPSE